MPTRRRGSRVRPFAVALVLAVAAHERATGQGNERGVVLQIRPNPGDTLHLRLEQRTVLTGKRTLGDEVSTNTIVTEMRVYSRGIVEDSVAGGTIMRTITDSVRLSSSDEHAAPRRDEAERALRGQTMRFRIAYDGTIALLDTGSTARDLSSMASIMPGAFPMTPLRPGATWVREMPLPGGSRIVARGGVAAGWLHAKFRLDSLTRRGAYISMRGEMSSEPDPRSAQDDQPVLEDGVVTGTMVVDRRRGWLAESQVTIVVHAVTRAPGAATMRFETKVIQRMKTIFGNRE